MISAVLGLLLPATAVWLVVGAIQLLGPSGSRVLRAALALGGGIGFSSVTTFWLVSLGVTPGPAFVALDAGLWLSVAALAWRYVRRAETSATRMAAPPERRLTLIDWAARVTFAVTAALALATVVAHYQAAPHGDWDAWGIWNQKARFLVRGGDDWAALLSVPWSTPSHPLLVSTSVARLWAYAGEELTVVPALLSAAFGAVIVAALIGALDASRARAWMAGSVLAAPGVFPQLAAAQTADLPTGAFVFLSLIMLRDSGVIAGTAVRGGSVRLLTAGVLGSFAAWTKNEGGLFLVITGFLIAWMALRRREVRPVAWWLAGAAPVLMTVIWFKIGVAPSAPLYLSDPLSVDAVVARVLTPERHAEIGRLAARLGAEWGGPFARGSLLLVSGAALLAASVGASRTARLVLAAVCPMVAGYYAVYLLTQIETTWLVSTTFDRLLIQVWPALVLAACSGGERRDGA